MTDLLTVKDKIEDVKAELSWFDDAKDQYNALGEVIQDIEDIADELKDALEMGESQSAYAIVHSLKQVLGL